MVELVLALTSRQQPNLNLDGDHGHRALQQGLRYGNVRSDNGFEMAQKKSPQNWWSVCGDNLAVVDCRILVSRWCDVLIFPILRRFDKLACHQIVVFTLIRHCFRL